LEISVELSQEQTFQKILDYLRSDRYFWVFGKRGHDIRNVVPPSRIESILGPRWAVAAKTDIEVVPKNGKSLVKIDFEWLDGRIMLLSLAIVLALLLPVSLLVSLSIPFFVAVLISPFFLGWLDVDVAKNRLMMKFKQLFQGYTTHDAEQKENRRGK